MEDNSFLDIVKGKLNIDPLHYQSLREIGSYIKSNKIESLFNELLTNVLAERPEAPREFIRELLKNVKQKRNEKGDFEWDFDKQFLTEKDFEALFDSYDVLGLHTIPVAYLAHALKAVGVARPEEVL